jgi:DNA-3-methyladenine glycosylase I
MKQAVSTIRHPDGRTRCWWPAEDPLYVAYHDSEWGMPERDDRALFEKLVLDGFQAGLSWITILRKRDAFRDAFAQFDPQRIAQFEAKDVDRLMHDAGIVRNRAKIEAAIRGAQAWLVIQEREGFSTFCWKFVDGHPLQPHFRRREDVPAETSVSQALSKALKREGFGFCGPTIVYAFMQAVGMTNDHLVDCCRHGACLEAGRKA